MCTRLFNATTPVQLALLLRAYVYIMSFPLVDRLSDNGLRSSFTQVWY